MKILENVLITKYILGMRMGVTTKLLVLYKTCEEIPEIKKRWPETIFLGKGWNTIFISDFYNGVIAIKDPKSPTKMIELRDKTLKVCASTSNQKLVSLAIDNDLSGMECLYMVPGTIGGSIAGNAGAGNKGICENVKCVEVCDDEGNIIQLNKFNYGYRSCSLKKYTILSAEIELIPCQRELIIEEHKRIQYLKSRQVFNEYSCGCIFKNPLEMSAGRLIESCGLLGERRGNYRISDTHGNFIINEKKGSKSTELKQLIEHVESVVKDKTGIILEREVNVF